MTSRRPTHPVPQDRSHAPRRSWIVAALLAIFLPGCASKQDRRSASPDAAPDDLAALEQQLTAREGQLQAVGVVVAQASAPSRDLAKEEELQHKKAAGAGEATSPAPTAPTTAPEPAAPITAGADASYGDEAPSSEKTEATGGRCMQVCEISAAICGLQDQICGLAPRHRDDPRYQAACDRAAADCRLSTEACHGCSEP